jgi:predicted Fe-Mo cluster-binding NifX family protein
MKIGISSSGSGLDSMVDKNFGRCQYFAVVEIENGVIGKAKFIENTASAQAGGAGVTASQLIASEGVDAIIASNMGPRALDVFSQLGIKMYRGEGNIADVAKEFIDGKLQEIQSATGPRHFGLGGR